MSTPSTMHNIGIAMIGGTLMSTIAVGFTIVMIEEKEPVVIEKVIEKVVRLPAPPPEIKYRTQYIDRKVPAECPAIPESKPEKVCPKESVVIEKVVRLPAPPPEIKYRTQYIDRGVPTECPTIPDSKPERVCPEPTRDLRLDPNLEASMRNNLDHLINHTCPFVTQSKARTDANPAKAFECAKLFAIISNNR